MQTQPSLFWHLVKKDFRYIRWWVLAVWVSSALILIQPLILRGWMDVEMFGQTQSLAYLLIFFAQAVLFQLEPCTDTTHFLATRPVQRGLLVKTKLFLWFAFLIVPFIIIRLVHMALLPIDIVLSDYFISFVEDNIELTMSFSCLLLLTIFTKAIPKLTLVRILIFLPISILAIILGAFIKALFIIEFSHFGISAGLHAITSTLEASRTEVLKIIIFCSSTIAIYFYYVSRKWWSVLICVCVGYFLTCTLVFWPYDFLKKIYSPILKSWDRKADFREKDLVFSLKGTPRVFTDSYVDDPDFKDIPDSHLKDVYDSYLKVKGYVYCEGLIAPLYLKQSGYHATATFNDKTDFEDIEDDNYDLLEKSDIPLSSALNYLKISDSSFHHLESTLFSCNEGVYDLTNKADKKVKITGEVYYYILQPTLLGEMTFQNSQHFNNHRFHANLDSVSLDDQKLYLKIHREEIRLKWRGDESNSWKQKYNLKLLVANSKTRDYFEVASEGWSEGQIGNYCLLEREMDFPILQENQGRSFKITKEWLADARLYWFSSEEVGKASFPFEISSIELKAQ